MGKSSFGLGYKNTIFIHFTRYCCLTANEGQNVDSLIFTGKTSSTSFLSQLFPLTQQPLRSLTDPTLKLQLTGYLLAVTAGCNTAWVSGLSLMAMPPREQTLRLKKITTSLFINLFGLFSSSRYSLALLGLKGDQTSFVSET